MTAKQIKLPEVPIHYQKTETTYRAWVYDYHTKQDVEVFVTVNFDRDSKKRTVTIHGKHDKFEFRESDPALVKLINRLIEKGVDLANEEPQVRG